MQQVSERSYAAARTEAAPVRMPAVQHELRRLEEEVALLGSVADDLLVRIHSSLRPEGPQPVQDKSQMAGMCPPCDLAREIDCRRESLSALRLRIVSALERIEL